MYRKIDTNTHIGSITLWKPKSIPETFSFYQKIIVFLFFFLQIQQPRISRLGKGCMAPVDLITSKFLYNV